MTHSVLFKSCLPSVPLGALIFSARVFRTQVLKAQVLIALFVIVMMLLGCKKAPVSPLPVLPAIVWEACDGADLGSVVARCGRYFPGVPGQTRQVFIRFAVFTPAEAAPSAAPVVFMAGGPGDGANTQGIKLKRWRYWLIDNPIKRPLIVWDSRGNEGAWGYFECEAYRLWSLNQLTMDAGNKTSQQELHQVKRCVERWGNVIKPQNFTGFSSQQSARDILGLLRALHFTQWHIWSVSYGSRVAEWLAALAPLSTKSLLLDSPYAWQVQTVAQQSQFWWQAFERFFIACDVWQCLPAVPMAELFAKAVEQIDQHNLRLSFELDGYRHSAQIDAVTFAHLVFALLYHPVNYPLVAQLLSAVAKQPASSNQTLEVLVEHLAPVLANSYAKTANPWLYWVTQCNDNHFTTKGLPVDQTELSVGTIPAKWQRFLMPSHQATHNDVCQHAKTFISSQPPPHRAGGQGIAGFNAIPTVVVSAIFDPVTPIKAALGVALKYNGVLLQSPTAGHGVLLAGECSGFDGPHFWQNPTLKLSRMRQQAVLPLELISSNTIAAQNYAKHGGSQQNCLIKANIPYELSSDVAAAKSLGQPINTED